MVEEFNGLFAKKKEQKIQIMFQGIVFIGLVQSQAKLEVSLSLLEAKLQACKKFFGPRADIASNIGGVFLWWANDDWRRFFQGPEQKWRRKMPKPRRLRRQFEGGNLSLASHLGSNIQGNYAHIASSDIGDMASSKIHWMLGPGETCDCDARNPPS